MPQKRKRSEPKLFHCTGFGHCDMVFTRSEHLARHARKHTGEKPFKCLVSTCDRMFSRFDNMIQHTHTHKRIKKKESTSNIPTQHNDLLWVTDQSTTTKSYYCYYPVRMPQKKIIELSTLIQDIDDTYVVKDIEMTMDEFEALQGFGRFCKRPTVRITHLNQIVSTLHESFIRKKSIY